MSSTDIWAVVPVKETADAKQRLATVVPAEIRRRLALAMVEDVLAALTRSPDLGGICVVTVDAAASELARRHGALLLTAGARDGQTGAVSAAAHFLAREGRAAMLTIPGDVPLIQPGEVQQIIDAHDGAPDFIITPAHDGRGSNAVLCAPPQSVPLKFGDDSFLPHLEAARRAGLEPKIIRLEGIALDIDHPQDLARFMRIASRTRTRALLENAGIDLS